MFSRAASFAVRGIAIAMLLYASWLLMMGIHELGHAIHAIVSGGRVSAVYFSLWDFSRTDFASNPHPQFAAWGGLIWGCVLPLAAFALICLTRSTRLRRLARFFAGFCLIANGAYIGLGWINRAGDAGTLLRHGAPLWLMITFGVLTLSAGLFIWHGLGSRFGLGDKNSGGL